VGSMIGVGGCETISCKGDGKNEGQESTRCVRVRREKDKTEM